MSDTLPNSSLPFSRPFEIDSLHEEATPLHISADERERAALAEADGIVSVDRLEADLTLRREGRSGLHVSGTVTGRITQTCVVSLEPFEAEVNEPVDVRFLPEAEVEIRAARRRKAPEAEVIEEDLPDPIVDGRVDLGALVAEHLALGLDPYPKKPGVAFVEPPARPEDAVVSPFAALSRLKTDPRQ